MKPALEAIWRAIERLLRGPRVSRQLVRLGIDPRRYWLLMDLFRAISERGEMMDQLGRAGVALEFVAWLYFALSVLLTVALVLAQPPAATYFLTFQGLSAFFLLSILISESGNSLVNPVEALALAHQPINGPTYTAAKLSHLLRIILYLVPGLNAAPALGGLMLAGAPWFYPLLHLGAAFAVGIAAALSCCALFGWLIRFLPVKRLKAAGQLAGAVPFMGMMWIGQLRRALARLHLGHWLPAAPAARWGLVAFAAALAVAACVWGIRSLSADYLLRVSGMVRGGAAAGSRVRKSYLGALAARCFGGQPARGGFAFVSRMMLRDFQFRRQFLPTLFMVVFGLSGLVVEGRRIDAFSARFTPMHLMPHFLGMLLFFICNILVYGNDYKGVWIFQLVPSRAFDAFAGGVFAMLWLEGAVVPNLLLLPLLAWSWGVWHAVLFCAYSLAVVSVYLGLELRLIQGPPFSRQLDPARGAASIMIMMAGGMAAAVAVGLQYVLLFRWAVVLEVTTAALAVAAYFLVRGSIQAFAISMRHNLSELSGEAGGLYREVGV